MSSTRFVAVVQVDYIKEVAEVVDGSLSQEVFAIAPLTHTLLHEIQVLCGCHLREMQIMRLAPINLPQLSNYKHFTKSLVLAIAAGYSFDKLAQSAFRQSTY